MKLLTTDAFKKYRLLISSPGYQALYAPTLTGQEVHLLKLKDLLGKTHSTISDQLANLRSIDFITARKDKKFTFYTFNSCGKYLEETLYQRAFGHMQTASVMFKTNPSHFNDAEQKKIMEFNDDLNKGILYPVTHGFLHVGKPKAYIIEDYFRWWLIHASEQTETVVKEAGEIYSKQAYTKDDKKRYQRLFNEPIIRYDVDVVGFVDHLLNGLRSSRTLGAGGYWQKNRDVLGDGDVSVVIPEFAKFLDKYKPEPITIDRMAQILEK